MGLFITGVEKPTRQTEDEHHSVPYHKRKLLDQVRKLHLVHASARDGISEEDCSMVLQIDLHPQRGIPQSCRSDRLGTADLEGWILAESIIKEVLREDPPGGITFNRLECLSVGAWDDGRWGAYQRDRLFIADSIESGSHFDYGLDIKSYESRSGDHVCPSAEISDILWDIFSYVHAVDSCQYVDSRFDPFYDITGLKVIHGLELDFDHHIGHVRFHTSAQGFNFELSGVEYGLKVANLDIEYDRDDKPVFRPKPASNNDPKDPSSAMSSKDSFELCILADDPGDEEELRLAREIKGALDKYREEAARTLGEAFQDNFKMFIEDEVPPCPCCGERSYRRVHASLDQT